MSSPLTLDDVVAARQRLVGLDVVVTPVHDAGGLSRRLGARVVLKLENLQRTGSFKVRGAGNRIAALAPEIRARGVIAMSAGNHAQGVAFHAARLGAPATIVMPRATPFSKIERTEALGAEVILEGASLADAAAFARDAAERRALTFVHPYDDALVIAGQGTIALELLEGIADLDMIIVPVGGGGLIAGIAIAAKALRPQLAILGVQSAQFPAMRAALRGEAAPEPGGATLAEGIAVKQPGALTREIVRRLVDDIVLVDDAAIEHAVALLVTEEKLVVEGAGAAGVAAALQLAPRLAGRRVALVVTGGNIDSRVLASILMRGLAASFHLARLRVEIPDAPGMLARVAGTIAGAGGNIVEIVHQRMFFDVPVMRAGIDVVIETRGRAHLDAIRSALEAAGLRVIELAQRSGVERAAPPG
jgi:threonine dehydratase